MRRQLQRSLDSPAGPAQDRCPLPRCSFGRHVPEEHNRTLNEVLPPRDWSHLGRRVLAEAWRRLTEERASQPSATASPVVRAPGEREERP